MGPVWETGFCAIVVGIASMLLGARTAAAPADTPATGGAVTDGEAFRLDMEVSGVSSCFVYPEERTDATGCDGVDLRAVRQHVMAFADRSNLLAVAVLRQQESESMLVVLRTPEEMAQLSDKDFARAAGDLLKGTSAAIPKAEQEQIKLEQAAELLHVGPLEVLHLRVALHPFKQIREVALLVDQYFVLTEGHTRVLQFTTVATQISHMQPVIERLVQGLQGRPTHKRLGLSARGGYYAGQLIAPISLGLLLVAFAVVAFAIAGRRRARRRG